MQESSRNPWVTISCDAIFNRNCNVGVHLKNIVVVDREAMPTPVVMFNISKKTYEILPQHPQGTFGRGAILYGYLYLVQLHVGQVYRMDLYTHKEWEIVDNLQKNCRELVSDGKNLFSFGLFGFNWVYDFVHNDWEYFSSMSTCRDSYAIAIHEDKIYVIGGYRMLDSAHSNDALSSVEVFDTTSKSWHTVADLPRKLGHAAAAVYRKRWIIVTGGKGSQLIDNYECFIFDLKTLEWTESTLRLAIHRSGHGSVVVDDNLFLFGGITHISEPENTPYIERIDVAHLIPNWGIIGHIILLRHLVDSGRANINDLQSTTNNGLHLVVEKLMTKLNIDAFKAVLSFLIPD